MKQEYRVVIKNNIFSFTDYSEAKLFKKVNGGVIYEKCFSTRN